MWSFYENELCTGKEGRADEPGAAIEGFYVAFLYRIKFGQFIICVLCCFGCHHAFTPGPSAFPPPTSASCFPKEQTDETVSLEDVNSVCVRVYYTRSLEKKLTRMTTNGELFFFYL